MGAETFGRAAQHLWHPRVASRRRGHLWSHFVFRQSEGTGDRHPHGVGRHCGQRAGDDPGRSDETHRHWSIERAGNRLGRLPGGPQLVVRLRPRCSDVCTGAVASHPGGHSGLLATGDARHAHRPGDGAAERIGSPRERILESDLVLVQNVSKLYRLYRRPADRLWELLPRSLPRHTDFWPLRDINFSLEKGEALGVVGPNGSGKSTLLEIVSGILQPTAGRVVTRGRVAALLELGAGFNPEFTGRENVYLNGEILGMPRREMERVFPQIEKFAEIGTFLDRPVKEYSSGMYVRLAFATAIHVEPEILIVDEALAVGDAIFANRCIKKFEELKHRKVTVLFVSHDLGLVKRLSDRAALMVDGRVAAYGAPSEVVNRYVGMVLERQGQEKAVAEKTSSGTYRHGDGASRVESVELLNAAGDSVKSIETGEHIPLR